jgi:transcriptional regulator with XRE-family HTH domain
MKTIRELREERGESRMQLAAAIGVTLNDVVEWELGRTEPTTSRLHALTEHFGVRDDQVDLRPRHDPSIAERLTDALEGGS